MNEPPQPEVHLSLPRRRSRRGSGPSAGRRV